MKFALMLSAMALVGFSSVSHAQRGGGGGGGRGGQRNSGGNSDSNTSTDVGVVGAPPMPTVVAALAIEHAAELKLTDTQTASLAAIRFSQDSANRPRLRTLDSLRPTSRPANGPNDLSPEQKQQIEERRAAIAPVLEAVRETNAEARVKVMALLNDDQQKRAAQFEEEARKKAQDEAKRRAPSGNSEEGGGRRRGGGGGGGRPMED